MKKKQLKYFKESLEKQLEDLLKEAHKTLTDMSSETTGNVPDPTDLASLETDQNFLLRIRDRERKLIQKIREALDRIEIGSFGNCELCGEEITEDRLKARPVATQCIECKTEMETHEKKMRQ